MAQKKFDFLVIGAGVVGVAIGLELKKRFSKSQILIIEKEDEVAFHSSGRNSGVLHAGFYYTADSLKAKFTRVGNQLWKDYCERKKLRINKCGKLVVAKDASEIPSLEELFRRANKNDVVLKEISEQDAKEIEPRVKTYQKAAWSPNTAVVDPIECMKSLVEEAQSQGIEFLFGCQYKGRTSDGVKTSLGDFIAGYTINAAGLYADKIAQDYGLCQDFRLLPFKGLYLYCTNEAAQFKTHIYPVPNLKNPFLGVHHTLTVDGHSKIGPTAIPAFWREQYDGFSRFKFGESMRVVADEATLFFAGGFDFRSLALEEVKKYRRSYLVSESASMATDVRVEDYTKWGRPGIRAQLFNLKTRKLEMDFKLESNKDSMHVLNAVSPAFTCAFPFAEHVVDQIDKPSP
jgi:L-2-hydroxyglutarate oxidase LhgO